MKQLLVRIEDWQHAALRKIKYEEEKDMAEIIREILNEKLKREKKK